MLTAFMVVAQGALVGKYFNQFADNEDYVKVSISSKMFSLFTDLEAGSEDEQEFLKAVSKLKGLKIIVGDSVPDSKKLYTQAMKDISSGGYEELMSVRDAGENFQFSIKEQGTKIEELIMLVGGGKQFILLSLYGEIDLKNISKIAKGMKISGFSQLEKLGHKEKEEEKK